jgi:hypothetical protein
MDSFLSWPSLVGSGLNGKLFLVEDIEEVGYWVSKIQSEQIVHGFIVAYGCQQRIVTLTKAFRRKKNPYRNWPFVTRRDACDTRYAGLPNSVTDQSKKNEIDRPSFAASSCFSIKRLSRVPTSKLFASDVREI